MHLKFHFNVLVIQVRNRTRDLLATETNPYSLQLGTKAFFELQILKLVLPTSVHYFF